jgi:regulator of protease activity HflC (stomatin/prohibitin superfamily)
MNWKFEKFMTLKIQTDDLEKIQATSADNINMMVTSTVNWRITDPVTAATMAAETMASSGKTDEVKQDITKLRNDVLKQALASLAAFIGGVNYSESFHMSAATQSEKRLPRGPNAPTRAGSASLLDEPCAEPVGKGFSDNPLYDTEKMMSAVEHSNRVTRTYGIEVMSINIISAAPVDASLTKSLAAGAVASAEALQAETAARGTANAIRISAEATAEKERIESQGLADSEVIQARAMAEATRIKAASAKEAEILCGEGAAERTRLHAAATSEGLEIVGRTVEQPGGKQAMVQRLAEQYITELPAMAKHSKMMIVPDKPNDVSGVVATALSMTQAIHA